ncbi:hypothetical protein IC006_0585 [Sulfuracidifex tepidarius]|uniref:Uncharacterized protein n=1 Tax=Sulfuracidifex tepidarius TaxID=1294262 RepID=A0A510DT07_9CREN|nr:hypothetical protein IC006_0585 [Sulfuracidifex tepidarius]
MELLLLPYFGMGEVRPHCPLLSSPRAPLSLISGKLPR